MAKLAGSRSAMWAFMEKFEIPNFDTDGNYLTRWRLIQTPWFGIYLHRIDTPDSRPTLHDHPWPFVAFVCRGGYVERRLNPMTREVNEAHRIRWVNRMRTHDAHAIVRLLRVPTWTLVLVGARRRTWGYWEPMTKVAFIRPTLDDPVQMYAREEIQALGWRWTEFNQHPHNDTFLAALERRKP